MKGSILKHNRWLYYILAVTLIIALLWMAYKSIDNKTIMPSPWTIFSTFGDLLSKTDTYIVVVNTFFRLVICLVISFALALLLSILSLYIRVVDHFLHPFIVIIRTVPLIATLCIFLMIVGRNLAPYIISCILIFPIFYEALKKGIYDGMIKYRDIWTLDSNINLMIIREVVFPISKPFVQTSLMQSFGLGIKMLVMAEYFAQTKNSIGKRIYDAVPILDFASVFSWCLILVIIILVIEVVTKLLTNEDHNYA